MKNLKAENKLVVALFIMVLVVILCAVLKRDGVKIAGNILALLLRNQHIDYNQHIN